MVVRKNNINKVPEHEQELLGALLRDLADINSYSSSELEIHWQDWHNDSDYPDFYGTYTLRFKNSDEIVGIEMTIDELDTNMCTLINYLEHVRT